MCTYYLDFICRAKCLTKQQEFIPEFANLVSIKKGLLLHKQYRWSYLGLKGVDSTKNGFSLQMLSLSLDLQNLEVCYFITQQQTMPKFITNSPLVLTKQTSSGEEHTKERK